MLKKLQDLLFEEDEDIEDEEEEVVEKPHKVKQVQKEEVVQAQPKVESKPVVEQKVVEEKPAPQPVEETKAPSFDSLFSEPEEPVKPAKKQLGITLDEAKPTPVQEKKKVEPTKVTPIKKPKPTPTKPIGYEFKPVISPIFGVDEKDLTAVKNTARKYSAPEKIKSDSNVSPIISPMYGTDSEDSPSLIADTVEKSEILEKTVGNVKNYKAEDDIPEFSLDDILLASDNEFSQENKTEEKESPKAVNDETLVLDKTLFPSDEGLD